MTDLRLRQVEGVTKPEVVTALSFEVVSPLDPAPAGCEPTVVGEGDGSAGVDQTWHFSRDADAALEEARARRRAGPPLSVGIPLRGPQFLLRKVFMKKPSRDVARAFGSAKNMRSCAARPHRAPPTFRIREPNSAFALQSLLATPLKLSLLDRSSGGKAVLSSIELDLAPFAAGATSLEVTVPLSGATPEAEAKLVPGAAMVISITLTSAGLVTAEEAASGAIVSLVVDNISPLPPMLAQARQRACPSVPAARSVALRPAPIESAPCPSQAPLCDSVTYTAAVILGSRTLLLPGASGLGEAVTWPGSKGARRIFLRSAEVVALRDGIRSGVPQLSVQMARYIKPEIGQSDPNHAAFLTANSSPANLTVLLRPGISEATLEQPLGSFPADMTKAVPPPVEGGKPFPEPAPGPDSVWRVAGSKFKMHISLSRPLFPPWTPPKLPAQLVPDIIAPRPPPPLSAVPPPEAAFRSECQSVASRLAALCARLGGVKEGSSDRLRAAVAFELNRSGEFLAIKSCLAEGVAAVVAARGGCGDSADARAALYADVYAALLDEAHTAVRELCAEPQNTPPAVPPAMRSAALAALAAEYEAGQDVSAAERAHQENIVVSRALGIQGTAVAWAAYGTFLLRTKRAGAGREALSESCALDGSSTSTLFAMGAVLLEEGRRPDLAESFAFQLTQQQPDELSGWALLAEALEAAGPAKAAEAYNARFRASEMAGPDNGLLAPVAATLVAFGAPRLALSVAAKVTGRSAAAHVACATAQLMLGDNAAAGAAVAAALDADPAAWAAHEASGHVAFVEGNLSAAEEAYLSALTYSQVTEAPPSLLLLLRLGHCLAGRGAHQEAAAHLLAAAAARGSVCCWMEAGRALLALGQPGSAEEALAEANVQDTTHFEP